MPYGSQGGGWNAQVVLTMPLDFEGLIRSETRQAESQKRQSEAALEKTRRLAESEIKSTYALLSATEKARSQHEQAGRLSLKNFQVMTLNFKRGLVTNIDVLTALASAEDSQRLAQHEAISIQMLLHKLRAQTSKISDLIGSTK